MVCDEQIMLYSQDVFKLLVKRKWTIIVPHQAIYELSNMSKTGQPDAEAAKEALQQVRVAYKQLIYESQTPKVSIL
jgi:hypothetical protein